MALSLRRRFSTHSGRLFKRAKSPNSELLPTHNEKSNGVTVSETILEQIDPLAHEETCELRVLHDPGQDTLVDIVAVHGLGNDFDAWESVADGESWLTSLLTQDFPYARIFAFSHGRNPHPRGLPVRDALHQRVTRLLDTLTAQHASREQRPPLVFIAHSLGGLVVQRALLIAKDADDSALRNVFLATRGMIYLGVPGTQFQVEGQVEDPEGRLRKALVQMLLLGQSRSTERLRGRDAGLLSFEAASLEVGMRAFEAVAERLQSVSVCFCEGLPVPGWKGQVIVDRDSAVRAAEHIVLQRSHLDLVRFDGRHDEGYAALRDCLGFIVSNLHPSSIKVDADHLQKLADKYSELSFLRTDFDIRPQHTAPSSRGLRTGLLDSMHRRFAELSVSNKAARVALVGHSGVGKTYLARHYAHRASETGRSVFWLNAASRETLCTSYLEIARAIVMYYWSKYADQLLRLEQDDEDCARALLYRTLGFGDLDGLLDGKDFGLLDELEVTGAVKCVTRWLMCPGNRWLLVLDDLGDDVDVAEFAPSTLDGDVLLVMQKRDSGVYPWGTAALEVPSWSESEAYQLLQAESGQDHDPAQEEPAGQDIVRDLDYDPLLLHYAAATIRNRGISFHQYHTSLTSLDTLLNDLDEHPRRDHMKDVLAVSSLFSDVPLPLDLLISVENAVTSKLSGDMGGAWWRGGTPTSDTRRGRLMDYLLDRGLIDEVMVEDVAGASSQSYFIPRAIRRHFQEIPTARHAWLACSACATTIQRRKSLGRSTLSASHSFAKSILPHIQACYGWTRLFTPDFRPGRRDPRRIDWPVLGALCSSQGDLTHAAKWLELALQRSSLRLELDAEALDSVAQTRILSSLVETYQRTGEVDKCDDRLRDLDAADLEPEFCARLAWAEQMVYHGSLDAAVAELDALARRYEAEDGGPDRRHVIALRRLASVLEMVGRYDEASSCLARLSALCASHLNLGAAHPLTLEILEHHAAVLQHTAHAGAAKDLLATSLTIKLATLGSRHPSTLFTQARVAALHDELGDYPAADKHYLSALVGMEDVLGELDDEYLSAKEDLGVRFKARAERAGARSRGDEEAEMAEWSEALLRDVSAARWEVLFLMGG